MSKFHPMPDTCPDAVPIKVDRVFDSCSDRDCLSNVQILMDGGELPPQRHAGKKPMCKGIGHLYEYRASTI